MKFSPETYQKAINMQNNLHKKLYELEPRVENLVELTKKAEELYRVKQERRSWVLMTQNILYGTDQISDFDSEEYNQNLAGKYAEAPDRFLRTGKSDADLQKCRKVW